jgi:hypothetical protein
LSFKAWLEIKANRWACFTTNERKEIRGTIRLTYSRCKDDFVQVVWPLSSGATVLRPGDFSRSPVRPP